MRIRGTLRASKLSLVMLTVLVITAGAMATTLAPNPMLDIQGQGLSLATGGTGMIGGSGAITVDIGGPVVTAVLYWGGRDAFCAAPGAVDCVPPGADDELLLDGTLVAADRLVGDDTTAPPTGIFATRLLI